MQHLEGHVTHKIENRIATIEFFHPSSNALPAAILTDLARTINDMSTDTRARVIVLKSEGGTTFCSGASFDELSAIQTEDEGKKFFMGFANVINAMRKSSKLIISRVHAKAIGGGVGLIAATDYAFATKDAEVRLSELSVGIGPFVVGPAVERKIGTSCFSQLAIDATGWRNAEWAKRHGLYAELHNTVIELDDAINVLADKLASSNPEAMSELKKIFWAGTDNWDTLLAARAATSGRLILSDFSKNAINKFRNKVTNIEKNKVV